MMMIPSLPAKILIGISLDDDGSKELLSWAIKVLARPGDTVVALHVIAAMSKTKSGMKEDNFIRQSMKKHQNQLRQAKSLVISIMGELVKPCQSNEVNLEARVGLNNSISKGLVEEAKNMGTDYLIIGGKKKRSNRAQSSVSKYCYQHVPEGCSLVLVQTRREALQNNIRAKSMGAIQEFDQESSNKWSEKNSYTSTDDSFSSSENQHEISSNIKSSEKSSPRTVLDICKRLSHDQSHSINSDHEDGSNSSGEYQSTITDSPCVKDPNKQEAEQRKPISSSFKRISSFFSPSSCDHWSFTRRQNKEKKKKDQPLLTCFSYEEIANATNNFHIDNLIGQGGYSEVYKGDLANGRSIAVKRLTKDNTNAKKEKEFLMELGIIGHVNHPNTAKLVGCCIENGLYLVFELYPNGTLSSALHGHETSQSLDWPTRYKIALGTAKGLHYLHKCCKHRIIHRDIKASNVLLGPDYEPQISDFGLAKWLPSKWTHQHVIPIEGTFGYLAPEYFMHGIVDEKTDVYAFGILLLEIITGRRPVDSTRQNLLLWAKPLMESGNLSQLADPKLEGKYDMEQLFRVVLTASYCVRQTSIWRPSMTEVLQLLTYGQEPGATRSWRIPKFTSDELDDYSMIFGYELPSDLSLENI